MLTLQDCIASCGLTEEEVDAIAEHEHLPEIVAAELGNYLLQGPDGVPRIKRIILDDIAAARARRRETRPDPQACAPPLRGDASAERGPSGRTGSAPRQAPRRT